MLQVQVTPASVIYCYEIIHSLTRMERCGFRVYTAQEPAKEKFRECTPHKEQNAPTGKF
jgi:hypothetical protein